MFVPEADFIEAKIEVPRLQADAVCNFIIENISSGLVLDEEDDSPVTGVTFYVDKAKQSHYKAALQKYLSDITEPGSATPHIREVGINNSRWVDDYRTSVKPLVIAEDIVIRPPWSPAPIQTPLDIVLEPRMAFGTGTHETTRGCLEVLRRRFKKGMTFLDLGTGSGILSILADKLGASYILAVDYDAVAIDNCRENFALNNVLAKYDLTLGSAETCSPPLSFDVVCANIIKSTILPLLPNLLSFTKPGGLLVLSGLLDTDSHDVNLALQALGTSTYEIKSDGEWLTYAITNS